MKTATKKTTQKMVVAPEVRVADMLFAVVGGLDATPEGVGVERHPEYEPNTFTVHFADGSVFSVEVAQIKGAS